MTFHRILTLISLTTLVCCTNSQTADNLNNVSKDTLKTVHPDTTELSAIGKRGIGLTLSQDSGFIIKKDGLRFLLSVGLTDTAGSYWSQAKDNDTIGKYYHVKQTDNFFMCTIDLTQKYSFETHLILEIKADGTILKHERFFHGNYPCCWDNYYEGFNKCGDFFCLKTCGTGSGYCSSYIYLFKNVASQDKQNSIPVRYFAQYGENANELSSTMQLTDTYIIVHYVLKTGKLVKDIFKVKKTERFDIKYILQNDTWVATDSTKLKSLDI